MTRVTCTPRHQIGDRASAKAARHHENSACEQREELFRLRDEVDHRPVLIRAPRRNTDAWTDLHDEEGLYRFAGLQPGTYSFKAEVQGFAPFTRSQLTLNVGATVDQDVTMQISGVQESVTVSGAAPIIESAKTDLSTVITQDQIEGLPTRSRNYLDFALLTDRGTIEPGKLADIIVINGNPLYDITALSHVEVVVKDGVVFKGGPGAKAPRTNPSSQ